jgi:hypothetical protein
MGMTASSNNLGCDHRSRCGPGHTIPQSLVQARNLLTPLADGWQIGGLMRRNT